MIAWHKEFTAVSTNKGHVFGFISYSIWSLFAIKKIKKLPPSLLLNPGGATGCHHYIEDISRKKISRLRLDSEGRSEYTSLDPSTAGSKIFIGERELNK